MEGCLESRQIADVVRGAILLSTAALMIVLLLKLNSVMTKMGIPVRRVYYFPLAIVVATSWLTYRGLRTILAAFRDSR